MKNLYKFLFLFSFSSLFFSFESEAQAVRNPVLEYCTGTWCQYCPCGHAVIHDVIMLYNPNTVVLSYHGPANSSDPFRVFSGNTIISAMGFSSYPTGIVDRLTVPQSRSAWAGQVSNRSYVPPKVSIDGFIGFEIDSNKIHVRIVVKALAAIAEIPVINFILTEDKLIAPQTGSVSAGCIGGTDYRHDNVVRSMLNGALGNDLAKNGWAIGDSAVVDTIYYLPTNVISSNNLYLNSFVYSKKTPLNQSEIHQSRKWKLVDFPLPVELGSFTSSITGNSVILIWSTASEKNNNGFLIERSNSGNIWSTIGFVNGNGTSVGKSEYSFTDEDLSPGIYQYRLKQIDFDGSHKYHQLKDEVEISVPTDFNMSQNFPNPFNPGTKISFSIPKSGFVSLKVYDLLGKEVATVVSGNRSPGNYTEFFDASSLPSGVYVYQLQAEGVKISRKMSLLK